MVEVNRYAIIQVSSFKINIIVYNYNNSISQFNVRLGDLHGNCFYLTKRNIYVPY